MAWDKTKPANTEKIRDLGTVIRANWTAIEENDTAVAATSLNQWVVHLLDRSTIGGANTPTRVDNVGMLYCRSDGTENELFFLDSQDPAQEIQITQDGNIGTIASTYQAESISFDGTVTYDETMLPRAWGIVASGGASLTVNKNIDSVSNQSTGVYRVDITGLGFSAATDYAVLFTGGFRNRICGYENKTSTTFDIYVTNDNGTAVDAEVTVMIMMA